MSQVTKIIQILAGEEKTIYDKSGWRDGPWKDEIDEKIWYYGGAYRCKIIRHPEFGSLCGYVGVPVTHPLYGKSDDTVDLIVHGGVTFSGRMDDDEYDLWYFGFDCAHVNDDWMVMPSPIRSFYISGEYRTIAYVESQCNALADQLEDAQ